MVHTSVCDPGFHSDTCSRAGSYTRIETTDAASAFMRVSVQNISQGPQSAVGPHHAGCVLSCSSNQIRRPGKTLEPRSNYNLRPPAYAGHIPFRRLRALDGVRS